MDLNPTTLIAVGVLHLIVIADVWASRLSTVAKVLWTLTVLCMVGVGLASWLLTRHTAYQELEPIPEAPAEGS